MAAGSIVVDLLLNTGSFETSSDRAAKSAQKRTKEIESAFKNMATVVAASFVATAGALALLTKNAIDGIDALNDVSDATGASIENISALEQVALNTGTTLDNVSSILVKFSDVLKEADPDSPMALALKQIGLNADELRRIDPAEALRLTAVALSQYAEDGNKARLVQELFGKSVKDSAPFLKDLAEQTALVGTTTKEQADAADRFNKSLFGIQASVSLVTREFATGLLPTLQELSDTLRQFARDEDAVSAASGLLNGALSAVKVVFQTLAVIATDVIFVFQGIGREIGAIAAQLVALAKLDFRGFSAISDAVKEDSAKARKELDALQARILGTAGTTVTTGTTTSTALPSVGIVPSSGDRSKAVKAQADAIKRLTDEEKANADFLREVWWYAEKAAEDAGRATNDLIVSNFKAAESYRDLLDPTRAINREIKEIQALVEAGALTPDEGLAAELKKLNDFYDDAKDKTSELDEFTKQAARNIQTSLAEFIFDPFKDGVNGMLEGFLNALRQMAAQAAAAQISKALFGDMSSGGSNTGFLGGALSSLFGGFRANGGPVSGGTSYVVGERGPELFTPSTSGRIIPNEAMGGGSVNVSVQVDASGSKAQGDSQKSADLGRIIGGEIRRILIQEQRPGGILA